MEIWLMGKQGNMEWCLCMTLPYTISVTLGVVRGSVRFKEIIANI